MVVEIEDPPVPNNTAEGGGAGHILHNTHKADHTAAAAAVAVQNPPPLVGRVSLAAAAADGAAVRSPPLHDGNDASLLPSLAEQGSALRFGGASATNTPNQGPIPRLVKRNLPFHQSLNRVQVTHNQGMKIFLLLQHDWFHVILRVSTYQSLLVLLSIWTGVILFFAGLYVWIDRVDPMINCGLGHVGSPITFGPAFAFSLETTTTGVFFDLCCFLFFTCGSCRQKDKYRAQMLVTKLSFPLVAYHFCSWIWPPFGYQCLLRAQLQSPESYHLFSDGLEHDVQCIPVCLLLQPAC
jgi:hypothetical protein